MSQSPQTGQVYFNDVVETLESIRSHKSQSPQTGQVYFNGIEYEFDMLMEISHNPLKRVKFISILCGLLQ